MIYMALIKEVESPAGVKLENGYHKIVEGKLKWIEERCWWYMHYTVAHYYSRQTRREKKEPVYYSNYIMKVDLVEEAPHPITQAYEHLKRQEGFQNAEDV